MNDHCKEDKNGSCQHIGSEQELWTIPSGIHYFFGRIVSVSSSLEPAGTKRKEQKYLGDAQTTLLYIDERYRKDVNNGIRTGRRKYEQ